MLVGLQGHDGQMIRSRSIQRRGTRVHFAYCSLSALYWMLNLVTSTFAQLIIDNREASNKNSSI
jgi:hypothetical protein